LRESWWESLRQAAGARAPSYRVCLPCPNLSGTSLVLIFSVIEQECQPNARPGKLGFDHLISLALVLQGDHGGICAPQSLVGSRLGQPVRFQDPVLHTPLGPGSEVRVGDLAPDDLREGLVIGVDSFDQLGIPEPVEIVSSARMTVT